MKQIKFGEVHLNNNTRKYLNEVLDNEWLTHGKFTEKFETEWAKLTNSNYSIFVNSGTSALIALFASLYDLGAKRGQNIIMPALSFVSTWNAALAAGFNIKFVDIEINDSMNINCSKIEEQIDKDTIAICGVSLMGKPYNADIIQQICQKHKLWHIADQCEAHFCSFNNKPILHYADAEVYSFFAAHILYATEAGSINTNNSYIKDLCLSTRTHGRKNGKLFFDFERFGLNLKPTDLAAAVGLASLEESKEIFNKRKDNLVKLQNSLQKYRDLIYLVLEDRGINSPHALSITFKKENYINKLKEHLTNSNIEWKLNFQTPHKSKAFDWMNLNIKDIPNALWVSENGIHCACHQYLSFNDIEYMIEIFERFFKFC